jgi:hypothetical protein
MAASCGPESSFNHEPPRHQRGAHVVIEHDGAAADGLQGLVSFVRMRRLRPSDTGAASTALAQNAPLTLSIWIRLMPRGATMPIQTETVLTVTEKVSIRRAGDSALLCEIHTDEFL